MKLETIDDVLKLNTLAGIQDKAKANPQGKTMKLLVSRLTQTGIRDKVEQIIDDASKYSINIATVEHGTITCDLTEASKEQT